MKKQNFGTRLLSMLLALCMLASTVSFSAFAADDEGAVPESSPVVDSADPNSSPADPAAPDTKLPETDPTTPEESTPPEESTTPEESPAPEESTTPEGTPAPEESPVPEESPAPEESPVPEEEVPAAINAVAAPRRSSRMYAAGRELAHTITAGTVVKYVGEDGFYQRLPRLTIECGNCYGVAIEYIPDGETYGDTVQYDDDIVNPLTAYVGQWSGNDDYHGLPCYKLVYTAKTPGITPVNIKLDYAYDAPYEEGYCDWCNAYIVFGGNDTKYYDKISFQVNVVTDYTVSYQPGGNEVTGMPRPARKQVGTAIASTTQTFTAAPAPKREGYNFTGWKFSGDGQIYQAGATVTMRWQESDGRNVQETMTAQWEKASDKTYTVTYTDGVTGEIVFPDQGYEGLKEGDATPEFVGTPTREGYTFEGWAPTVNPVVSADDDADGDGKIDYTATWKKKETPPPTPTNPKLTGLQKDRLTSVPSGVTLPAGVTVNYDQNVVFVGDNPDDVTLLYRITVTGEAGAKYKVTDTGATHVGGAPLEGTIAANETTAVIYVIKTFSKDDVNADGKLVNDATLEAGEDTQGPDPDKGGASGSADASKKYNVTINFKTDEYETLQESTTTTVDEGGNFNYSVQQANARRARANSDVSAVVIPRSITKDGKTYALDEVASADGLAELAAAKNITADVVADIIYSLDMHGNATDPNGNPTDGTDGIPDKYQLKVTYKVENGYWNNTDKDAAPVIVWLTKYGNDGKTMSETGTAKLPEFPANVGQNPDAAHRASGKWVDNNGTEFTSVENTLLSGDSVFTYVYDALNNYSVKFHHNDGKTPETVDEAEVEENSALGEAVAKEADPTREGYTFDGWFTDKENGTQVDKNNTSPVTGSVDLYAHWTIKQYTVTFDPDPDTEGDEIEKTVEHGKTVDPMPDDPVKDEHDFDGWYVKDENGNDQPFDPDKPVTSDLDVFAKWTERTYTVQWVSGYDATVYHTEKGLKRAQIANNDEIAKLHPTNPTREGFTFTGWNIGTMGADRMITVTAQWTANTPVPTPTTPPTATPTPAPVTPTATPAPGGTTDPGDPDDPDDPDPAPAPAPTAVPVVPAAVPAPAAPGVPAAPAGPAVPAAPAAPAATLPEEETPLAAPAAPAPTATPAPAGVEDLGDDEGTPLAGPRRAAWALVNLILTVLTVLASILLLIGFMGKKQKELKDDNGDVVRDAEGNPVYEWTKKRHGGVRTFSLVPAIVAVVAFILTEDMRLPMILVDRWTLLMLLIALVQLVVCFFARKSKDEMEEEDGNPGGPAPARA